MNGWKYEWAAQLPPEVYDILIEEMSAAARDHEERMDRLERGNDEFGFD